MNLFAPRTWTASDITLTKSSSVLLGVALGLSMPKHCRRYAPWLLLGVAVLGVKPLVDYFRHDDSDDDLVPEDNGDRTPAGENL